MIPGSKPESSSYSHCLSAAKQ